MHRRVLHLLPTLSPSYHTHQVALLAEALSGEGFEQQVAVLRATPSGLAGARQAGWTVHPLRQRFAWDPFVWWRLRRLIQQLSPDAIHPWGAEAAGWAGSVRAARVVRNAAALPAGVALSESDGATREDLALPLGGRLIGVIARLVPAKQIKDLLWAFDMVRVVYDDLRLVVVGDGPQRPELQRFAQLACEGEKISFLGERQDVAALLPHFDVVWTADPRGSLASTLQAMAAARPVVCDRSGAGFPSDDAALLVAPGSRAERARATCRLLDQPDLRSALGRTARRQAEQEFSVDQMVRACRKAYTDT